MSLREVSRYKGRKCEFCEDDECTEPAYSIAIRGNVKVVSTVRPKEALENVKHQPTTTTGLPQCLRSTTRQGTDQGPDMRHLEDLVKRCKAMKSYCDQFL